MFDQECPGSPSLLEELDDPPPAPACAKRKPRSRCTSPGAPDYDDDDDCQSDAASEHSGTPPACKSARNSPSSTAHGSGPQRQHGASAAMPPALQLPAAATPVAAAQRSSAHPPPVPAAPSAVAGNAFQGVPATNLINAGQSIGLDESYGNDETVLNDFLKLHPMLSMEATSARTLQLLSNLFQKASIRAVDLPVVKKSHDDLFLRPPNLQIGERPCINGDRCLAQYLAKIRYGTDTRNAFTCTEFLLPDAYANFLNGRGLPDRRAKCLMCTRYFTNYIYLISRTDPSFKIEDTPLGVQIFCNACAEQPPPPASSSEAQREAAQIQEAQKELPTHSSSIGCKDGYKAEAMLFVDEDWMNLRSAREGKLGTLMWHPVVRFCSTDYVYEHRENEGPRILQVGIGIDDHTNGLGLFVQPPASPKAGASAAAPQRGVTVR